MAARTRRSRYPSIRPTHAVVPAKAGNHTPRTLDVTLERPFGTTTQAGGYGSLLSQGRPIEIAERSRDPS
jgi:hypothetical protein